MKRRHSNETGTLPTLLHATEYEPHLQTMLLRPWASLTRHHLRLRHHPLPNEMKQFVPCCNRVRGWGRVEGQGRGQVVRGTEVCVCVCVCVCILGMEGVRDTEKRPFGTVYNQSPSLSHN